MGDLLVITMPRFVLSIDLGNDAMCTGSDIADRLRTIADEIQDNGDMQQYHPVYRISDINGNKVGHYEVTE